MRPQVNKLASNPGSVSCNVSLPVFSEIELPRNARQPAPGEVLGIVR